MAAIADFVEVAPKSSSSIAGLGFRSLGLKPAVRVAPRLADASEYPRPARQETPIR